MGNNNLPIGLFDSGVGGLTVLAAVRARLPGESVLYLGDTARLPYGAKSPATIRRYALQCAGQLVAGGGQIGGCARRGVCLGYVADGSHCRGVVYPG